MIERIGTSLRFTHGPYVESFSSTVGKKEGEGPMGGCFDRVEEDPYFGEKTWEAAESRMQSETLHAALVRGDLRAQDVDCVLAGDLINQCTGSAFAMRAVDIPFLGIYGACSTMSEGLLVAAILTQSGACRRAAAVTSSHFSTAERQFRFPLSYGGQRTPTSQWTCTASGAVVLSARGTGVRIAGGCIGRIRDLGVTDATNMGAAMAPAAADTLLRYLQDTGTAPEEYDAIVTGDLGMIGTPLLHELCEREGIVIAGVHHDCGVMMFDSAQQDAHAGGSGCGCSASLLCGYFLPALRERRLHRILFAATGALLSAMSAQQGRSIPGICHVTELCAEEV